jgi:Cd2+/Zn2+-exporting ATPase
MLAGDKRAVGEAMARALHLDTACAELLQHQKVAQIELPEKQKETQGHLAYVGNGIYDAPVLKRSDVGITVGAPRADAAIEAAVKIARKTRRIALEIILFAVFVRMLVLIPAALGHATMWRAAFWGRRRYSHHCLQRHAHDAYRQTALRSQTCNEGDSPWTFRRMFMLCSCRACA